MGMRAFVLVLVLAVPLVASAGKGGVNVTMPLVEKTLRFLQRRALSPPSEAELLKAGAVRVCGEDFSRPGCKTPGMTVPRGEVTGPEANLLWRRMIESALAAASMEQDDFDKTVFQRYVMDAMVQALDDPSSFYILPSVYRKILSIPSDFVGFGFRVTPVDDALRVVAIHEGSPAHHAGLAAGDTIIRVNGEPVSGVRRPIALAAIWGADGTKIDLTLRRPDGTARDLSIEYESWPFEPFDVDRRGEVVVVRVRSFEKGLAKRVSREIAGACEGLVLDLRNAAGGGEEEMADLADVLMGEGPIGSKVVRGDLGNREWKAVAKSQGERTDVPVAVVINGGTSRLGEVLASALRESGRAILVGKKTAGIDTLETVRMFKDGSAIQVTSTRLLGPAKASLADGVLPHLETDRLSVVELAVNVVELTESPSLDDLIPAAKRAVALP